MMLMLVRRSTMVPAAATGLVCDTVVGRNFFVIVSISRRFRGRCVEDRKKETLCIHTFLQRIQICNQNLRILILKI